MSPYLSAVMKNEVGRDKAVAFNSPFNFFEKRPEALLILPILVRSFSRVLIQTTYTSPGGVKSFGLGRFIVFTSTR